MVIANDRERAEISVLQQAAGEGKEATWSFNENVRQAELQLQVCYAWICILFVRPIHARTMCKTIAIMHGQYLSSSVRMLFKHHYVSVSDEWLG
jgi:hypothetical protein